MKVKNEWTAVALLKRPYNGRSAYSAFGETKDKAVRKLARKLKRTRVDPSDIDMAYTYQHLKDGEYIEYGRTYGCKTALRELLKARKNTTHKTTHKTTRRASKKSRKKSKKRTSFIYNLFSWW